MRTVGIDLGTTNTVAAIEGTPIQLDSGVESSPILPSVVAFPPSGAVLAGTTARNRRAIDPKAHGLGILLYAYSTDNCGQ